jgi:hypothetical protein
MVEYNWGTVSSIENGDMASRPLETVGLCVAYYISQRFPIYRYPMSKSPSFI